jgi:hypothetical protein
VNIHRTSITCVSREVLRGSCSVVFEKLNSHVGLDRPGRLDGLDAHNVSVRLCGIERVLYATCEQYKHTYRKV